MSKRIKAVIGAIAVLIAVITSGCSTIKSGTVTDKDFTPAWMQWMPGTPPPSSCTGSPIRCTTTPGTPGYPIFHSDEWELRLKNSNDEGWREVSQGEYDRYKVGEHYP